MTPLHEACLQLHCTAGRSLTCAALALHGPHQVVGPLLAVQGLQQVKHIIIKHEMDQVEGACVDTQDEFYTEKVVQNHMWLYRIKCVLKCDSLTLEKKPIHVLG